MTRHNGLFSSNNFLLGPSWEEHRSHPRRPWARATVSFHITLATPSVYLLYTPFSMCLFLGSEAHEKSALFTYDEIKHHEKGHSKWLKLATNAIVNLPRLGIIHSGCIRLRSLLLELLGTTGWPRVINGDPAQQEGRQGVVNARGLELLSWQLCADHISSLEKGVTQSESGYAPGPC